MNRRPFNSLHLGEFPVSLQYSADADLSTALSSTGTEQLQVTKRSEVRGQRSDRGQRSVSEMVGGCEEVLLPDVGKI